MAAGRERAEALLLERGPLEPEPEPGGRGDVNEEDEEDEDAFVFGRRRLSHAELRRAHELNHRGLLSGGAAEVARVLRAPPVPTDIEELVVV